jgi:hypothetical protein
MNTLFSKRSETCTTQTRGVSNKANNVESVKGKVSSMKRSFPCRRAEVWNKLPVEIHAIWKKSKLKSALKKYLIHGYEERTKCSNTCCPDMYFF